MEAKTESVVEVEVRDSSQPTVILNSDGVYVGVNEASLENFGYSRDEIIGKSSDQLIASEKVNAGCCLQKIISGEEINREFHVQRKDGSTYFAEVVGTPIKIDGETHAKAITVDTREPETASASKKPDSSSFDDINQAELKQVVKNVRIDAPGGEMPLNAVLLDLAVGHNELEKYKQGALSMHQALDERLQEEEKNNPDSMEATVLSKVKETAFGLYLRIQRGDEELHGSREGRYKGYFN